MEKISVKKPFTVLVAVIIIIALGVVSLTKMTADLLPEVGLPYLMIMTPYPGASPEKVESELTEPMEQELGTVKHVASVSSVSAENYSVVQLTFVDNTNMDSAMVNVSSAVNRVIAKLDAGVGTPSIVEMSMDMIGTMYIAVHREGYDIYELSEYVNSDLVPYFQRLDGVASVTAIGDVEKSVHVDLNAEKIDALNEKILEKTNSALGEARAQLDAAIAAANAGQEELEAQEKRFGSTVASTLFSQLDTDSEALAGQISFYIGKVLEGLSSLEELLNQPWTLPTDIPEQLAVPQEQLAVPQELLAVPQELLAVPQELQAVAHELQQARAELERVETDKLGQALNDLDSLFSAANAAIAAIEIQGDTPDIAALRSDLQQARSARDDAQRALKKLDYVGLKEAMKLLRASLEQMAQDLRATADAAAAVAADAADAARRIPEKVEDLLGRLRVLGGDLEDIRSDLKNSDAVPNAYSHLLKAFSHIVRVGAQIRETLKQLEFLEDFDIRWPLPEQLSSVWEQLSSVPEQLSSVWEQLSSVPEQLRSVPEQLRSVREQLDALDLRTERIPELLDTLETVVAQFSQGQLDAALGFAGASQQLMQAQSELRTAEAQYEQAKKQALESANVDNLVSASTLSKLIYAQNFAMPAGYLDDKDDNSWLLRVGDEYETSSDIADALLANIDGIGTIRLGDIADITITDNALESYASLNGEDGIMLCIYKGSTAGTNAVSKACLQTMEELCERDSSLKLVRLLDQGKYITVIIHSILQSILIGALLAILVLVIFLKDIRPTIVVAVSIPLSVLLALVLMYFTNLSLNMMTLSGLALGIGMLVDNSIVVLENIVRLRSRGLSAARAAVQGTKQVSGAIIASTLTTISVFFPMVFTTGTVRSMLVPLSLTVSYCLVASLLVAVTVIPAASSTLLARVQPKPNRLMERIQKRYGAVLRWCLGHKALPLLLAIALLGLSLARLLSMGIIILPGITSDSVNVNIEAPEGITRDESYALADEVMERLLTIEGVEDVGIMDWRSITSSIGLSPDEKDVIRSYICYITVPEGTKNSVVRRMCRDAEALTADLNCKVTVATSGMTDYSTFSSSGLEISVTGRDMDYLAETAARVADAVRGVEGFTDVSDGSEESSATLHLVIDKDKAMEYGLTVAQIYAEIAGRLNVNVTATSIRADGFDMTVQISDNTDPLTVENLLDLEFAPVSLTSSGMDMSSMAGSMAGSMGGMEDMMSAFTEAQQTAAAPAPSSGAEADSGVHKLREFASLEETVSASAINRQDLTRHLTVSATTAPGYNTTVLVRSLQPALDKISATLPHGYSINVLGESQQTNEMIRQMVSLAALGLLFIYLIMVAQFQSLLSPFIILFTVPLAFTGGVLALLIAGQPLSMLSIMGFLILMGTVVNNGIVFVDYTNQLRIGGLEKWDALVATGQTRMRPILLTSLTTIFAMVMLIFGDDMGSEMGGGIAIVITGGLIYSTLMTLFIIPIIYDLFYRRPPLSVDIGSDINDAPNDAAEFLEARARELAAAEETAENAPEAVPAEETEPTPAEIPEAETEKPTGETHSRDSPA